MPAYQQGHGDRTVSSQKQPHRGAAGETAATSSDSPLFAEGNAATQFRFRILVVDDDPSIRETATLILESKGFEVLTAADGVEGLHSLSKSLPDLIISDLNMPRMSGFEFLAVVRQRFPHIATIAMSGGYSSTVRAKCQSEFWRTLSCKKETTSSKSFPSTWRSFWLLLLFARRERRVTSFHGSCQEIVRGLNAESVPYCRGF